MSRRTFVVSGVITGAVLFLALSVWYATAALRPRGGRPPLKYVVVEVKSSSADVPATTAVPDMLHQMVGELPDKEQTTYEWVRELQGLGFRICVEDIRRRPLERKINQFELRGNQELVQVLHDITQNDYRYRWDYVRGTDVINVVPIDNSHLTTQMEPIRFSKRPLIECFVHPALNAPEEVRTKVSNELKRKADQKKANQQQTMKDQSADLAE